MKDEEKDSPPNVAREDAMKRLGYVAPEEESSFVDDYYIAQIENFVKFYEEYCKDRGVDPSFRNFLFSKTDEEYVSGAYKFLIDTPRIFLASSRAFREYYETLDKDFQDDLMNRTDFMKERMRVKLQSTTMHEFMKGVLGEDYTLTE